jgi:callose synthase
MQCATWFDLVTFMFVLRAVCEHAYTLAQSLDLNSEARGVLQFKTGLISVSD